MMPRSAVIELIVVEGDVLVGVVFYGDGDVGEGVERVDDALPVDGDGGELAVHGSVPSCEQWRCCHAPGRRRGSAAPAWRPLRMLARASAL